MFQSLATGTRPRHKLCRLDGRRSKSIRALGCFVSHVTQDEKLLHAVLTHGTNWAQIAATQVPTRTTLALKNRFLTLRHRNRMAASISCGASKQSATQTMPVDQGGTSLPTEVHSIQFSAVNTSNSYGTTSTAENEEESGQSDDDADDGVEFLHADYETYPPSRPRTDGSRDLTANHYNDVDMAWMSAASSIGTDQPDFVQNTSGMEARRNAQTEMCPDTPLNAGISHAAEVAEARMARMSDYSPWEVCSQSNSHFGGENWDKGKSVPLFNAYLN